MRVILIYQPIPGSPVVYDLSLEETSDEFKSLLVLNGKIGGQYTHTPPAHKGFSVFLPSWLAQQKASKLSVAKAMATTDATLFFVSEIINQ